MWLPGMPPEDSPDRIIYFVTIAWLIAMSILIGLLSLIPKVPRNDDPE